MTGEEAISRQSVIEQIDNWSKDELLRVTNPFDYLHKRINSLPSVTSQPKTGHWIPVSERLPEENGQYLVTVKNLTEYEQLYNNVFECEFFEKDWIFKGWKDNKVIAWMPLPEPYKAESEVEECRL